MNILDVNQGNSQDTEAPDLLGAQENEVETTNADESAQEESTLKGETVDEEVPPETEQSELDWTAAQEKLKDPRFKNVAAKIHEVVTSLDDPTKIEEKINQKWARNAINQALAKYNQAQEQATVAQKDLEAANQELTTIKGKLDETEGLLTSYKAFGTPEEITSLLQSIAQIKTNPQAFKMGIMANDPQLYTALFGTEPTTPAPTNPNRVKEITSKYVKENMDAFQQLNIYNGEDDETGKKFIDTFANIAKDIADEATAPLMGEINELRSKLKETEGKEWRPKEVVATPVAEEATPETPADVPEPPENDGRGNWEAITNAWMDGAVKAAVSNDTAEAEKVYKRLEASLLADSEWNKAVQGMDSDTVKAKFQDALRNVTKPPKQAVKISAPKSVSQDQAGKVYTESGDPVLDLIRKNRAERESQQTI